MFVIKSNEVFQHVLEQQTLLAGPGSVTAAETLFFWPVPMLSVPVLLSAIVHNDMDHPSNHSPLSERRWRRRSAKKEGKGGIAVKYVAILELCGWRAVKRPEGCGLLGFRQVCMMECELLRVQITLTDSGPPRARLYENWRCYLGNGGEGFSKGTSCHFL